MLGQNCTPKGTAQPRMNINLLMQHSFKCFVAKHLDHGFNIYSKSNIYLSVLSTFLNDIILWQWMNLRTTLRTVK